MRGGPSMGVSVFLVVGAVLAVIALVYVVWSGKK